MGDSRMNQLLKATALLAAAVASAVVYAAVEPGHIAPALALKNLDGETVNLSQFKGKIVVLEWNNPHCPFVQKHYDSGNMQRLQRDKGQAVWLSVYSTNPTHGDYMRGEALKKWEGEQKAAPTGYLLDPEGSAARAYGAKTTPHMFVIDTKGVVAYAGAIDNKRSTDPKDVATATNYVSLALGALEQGAPLQVSSTLPYGCSVKY
jgi:hypothetical protein